MDTVSSPANVAAGIARRPGHRGRDTGAGKPRYAIRSRLGLSRFSYPGVTVALSKALTMALAEEKGGCWTVLEDDVEAYRVTRFEDVKSTIIVEDLR